MPPSISWQMMASERPEDSERWEATIKRRYGALSGHVELLVAIQRERWRVSVAKCDSCGSFGPGDTFPPAEDWREILTRALREDGFPVAD